VTKTALQAALAGLLFAPGHAFAEHAQPEPLARAVSDTLSYEARITAEYVEEHDFDLDRDASDLLRSIEPQASIALGWMPDDNQLLVVEFEASKVFLLDRPADEGSRPEVLELKQLYLHLYQPELRSALVLGRQTFQDETLFLFDEELDGARLITEHGRIAFEFAVTHEELFEKNLIEGQRAEPIDNYLAQLRYHHSDRSHTDAYVLARDDRSAARDGEDAQFFGIQSAGYLADPVRYWLNAAYVSGDQEEDRANISGFGLDAMATYAFDARWRPSATVGFAYGSGDDDTRDGSDRNFRQTGLHENTARFGGIENFRYLGEVFNPELSNMTIWTLGVGVRPLDNLSIDAVYHRYRQVVTDDRLRDAGIDPDPDGLSPELGQELDLIVGYQPREDVSIAVIAGAFRPGSAFGPDADPAYLGFFSVTLDF
jgi:alginate production protein